MQQLNDARHDSNSLPAATNHANMLVKLCVGKLQFTDLTRTPTVPIFIYRKRKPPPQDMSVHDRRLSARVTSFLRVITPRERPTGDAGMARASRRYGIIASSKAAQRKRPLSRRR